MKTYSGMMLVLDPDMGQNGLQYGVTANCRRFAYTFEAENDIWAKILCRQIGLIYDGEVIATYDADWGEHDDPADWWKS